MTAPSPVTVLTVIVLAGLAARYARDKRPAKPMPKVRETTGPVVVDMTQRVCNLRWDRRNPCQRA